MEYRNTTEYLEKLLTFAEGETAASEEAEKLTGAFPHLYSIASTDASVLKNLSGCNQKTADFIRLITALSSRRITDDFKSGRKYSRSEIERYVCALLFHRTVESVYMISFDKAGKLISADMITEGTINSSAFLPRKMVDIALRRRAASVILAHNHPSGNIVPSDNDIAVTLLAKTVLGDAHISLEAHYTVVGFAVCNCMDSINSPTKSSACISKINPLI